MQKVLESFKLYFDFKIVGIWYFRFLEGLTSGPVFKNV